MFTEQIEKIKQEYTDKYVVVDGSRPELARFSDLVGQVKTVNMSGRALVEFLDYHLNIGWYDIDLDFLKVVDKPAPKEEEPAAKKPAAKSATKKVTEKPAASEKKLSPLEMARQADSGGTKKTSTADVLAAARGGAKSAAPTTKPKTDLKPAGEGKADRSKMSVADMLAAARGGAAPSAPAKEVPAAKPEPTPEAAPAEEAAADSGNFEIGGPENVGPVDKSSMSIDEMVAYCREKDA